ncbi:MAG: hypothetical protein ACTSVV_12010 [Promethearchaeota archaeon]
MNRKQVFILAILCFNIFLIYLSSEVNAQTVYDMDIHEGDVFIWEVKEVNPHNFKKVFGFEPTFEVGDQTKKKIIDVLDTPTGWSVVVEEWDYKSDFEKNGTVHTYSIFKDPAYYDDNIFIPSNPQDYLTEASKSLPSKYIVQGLKVTKRESDYQMIKEYNDKGVLVEETYIDDDGVVLVRVEGTFRVVPFGNYFFGFMLFSILALIIIIRRKRILKLVY